MDTRLKFAGGEIEISSDELNLMPESNRNAIHSINAGLSANQDMILSGVNAVINVGVDVTISAGHVFLNGETLKVDAHVVPKTVASDLYEFQKVTTYPSEGARNFRDNTTHKVYEENRAVAVNVLALSDLSVDGDTIIDVLKALIRIQSDWTQADNTQPDFIKNKPTVVSMLAQGKVNGIDVGGGSAPTVAGDFTGLVVLNSSGDDMRLRINFTSIGTSSYHPLVTLQSNSANFDTDNDVKAMVKNLTSTSFELVLKEDVGNSQDITAIISIIPI